MKCFKSAIEMNATEQYFHVMLFIMLYEVVLTCHSDMIATEKNFLMVHVSIVYYAAQGVSNLWMKP